MSTAGRFLQPSLAWRAVLIGSTVNILSDISTKTPSDAKTGDHNKDFNPQRQRRRPASHLSFTTGENRPSLFRENNSWLSFLYDSFGGSINRTALEEKPNSFKQQQVHQLNKPNGNASGWTATSSCKTSPSPSVYDFVIIGGGNAGQAALKEIQQQCPGATIALIEPLERKHHTRVQEYRTVATAIDPHRRIVRLDESPISGCASAPTVPPAVQYRHAALIATGARAAPPPSYLVDEGAFPHLWELRTTQHRPFHKEQTDHDTEITLKSPHQVRQAVLQSARHGQRLAILGSGWDAVDLALEASSQPCRPPKRQRTWRANGKNNQHISLVFGAAGPMSHVLPPYLSSAVAKRLRVRRINLQERSMVRYINFDEHAQRLELYTAKSYDVLDTNRLPFDKIVVAPDAQGSRGSAWLPTNRVPSHLQDSREGRPWYQTWSQLSVSSKTEQPPIMCFQDDGRIAVNSELYACSGVYAAGSVAKWANAFNGQAQSAGWGVIDANEAGVVAGSNMARHYQSSLTSLGNDQVVSTSGKNHAEVIPAPIRVKDPFPIWRSDVSSYDAKEPSCLSKAGMTALCVGICDADHYSTHGVWWTNQSAQKRFLKEFANTTKTEAEEKKLRAKAKEEVTKSVYGIGVVYYLDQTGKIHGIMLWGLPFAMSDNTLKQSLLDAIREILLTNGRDAKSYDYFTGKSRLLALKAFSDGSRQLIAEKHRLDLKNLPRPLHRYTSIFTVSNSVRRRGHGSTQSKIHDDGLFARTQHDNDNPATVPPVKPKAGIGFDDASNPAFQQAQKVYEYQLWEQMEHQWDDNANMAVPPGEDIVWIRKGYEEKNTSARDKNIEMFNTALGRKASSSAVTANANYN